jgi:hypothetical protein
VENHFHRRGRGFDAFHGWEKSEEKIEHQKIQLT